MYVISGSVINAQAEQPADGFNVVCDPVPSLPLNQWTHVAIVHDSAGLAVNKKKQTNKQTFLFDSKCINLFFKLQHQIKLERFMWMVSFNVCARIDQHLTQAGFWFYYLCFVLLVVSNHIPKLSQLAVKK